MSDLQKHNGGVCGWPCDYCDMDVLTEAELQQRMEQIAAAYEAHIERQIDEHRDAWVG
jgi:hypothetical protein